METLVGFVSDPFNTPSEFSQAVKLFQVSLFHMLPFDGKKITRGLYGDGFLSPKTREEMEKNVEEVYLEKEHMNSYHLQRPEKEEVFSLRSSTEAPSVKGINELCC